MLLEGIDFLSWGWQEWIVAVLIVVCAVRIAYSIRAFFQRAQKKSNPCSSCASGCELKNQLSKRGPECKSYKPSVKKNCCG